MRKFHKTIVFTKTPLTKYFKYKDIFQIYPAQFEKMPYSNLQSHYPVILEYWTIEEEKIHVEVEYEILRDSFSDIATTTTKQDKILSLLCTLTNHLFFRYTDFYGLWGMPILYDNPGEEANMWSAKWIMPGFHWPEMAGNFNISNFTSLQYDLVDLINHFPYYLDNPNFDLNNQKEITFPRTIYLGLDSYFAASKEVKEVLDTAISYSVSAMELRLEKKTLALLASFTSVETMVNLEYKDFDAEKCSICGQLKYSVAKKYREYLLKYIGNTPSNKRKFNKYYSLRSKIVHTGQRLKTEKLYSEISKSEKDEEFLTRIEILQIGKMAIIQWLLKNPSYTATNSCKNP